MRAIFFMFARTVVLALILGNPRIVMAESASEVAAICQQSAGEARATMSASNAVVAASLLLALRAGDVDRATKDIEDQLRITVLEFGGILTANPCGLDDGQLSKVYQNLRFIAAIDNKLNIFSGSSDEKVRRILRAAVENDSTSYQKLVRRAEHWDNGIK